MLLIYNNPATYQAWTEEQRSALFGEVDVLMKELTESGELVGGDALADASNAVIVRDHSIRDLIPFDPMPYDDAVRKALSERQQAKHGDR